jgi:hypothetical protein
VQKQNNHHNNHDYLEELRIKEREKWCAYLSKLAKSNKTGSQKERLCSRRKVLMDKCGDRFDMAVQLLNELKSGKFELESQKNPQY